MPSIFLPFSEKPFFLSPFPLFTCPPSCPQKPKAAPALLFVVLMRLHIPLDFESTKVGGVFFVFPSLPGAIPFISPIFTDAETDGRSCCQELQELIPFPFFSSPTKDNNSVFQ